MDKDLKKRIKKIEKGEKPKGKKKKKETLSWKGIYDITLSNFQFHLYECIFQINGIDSGEYMYVDRHSTVLHKNIKINRKFMKLSHLDWNDPRGIDTLTYRGRFATLFLMEIIRNSHKIVKNVFNQIEVDVKKYETYNAILNEWIYSVDTFLTAFLSSDLDYVEPLEKLYQMLLVANGDDPEIFEKLQATKNLVTEVIHGKVIEEGVVMNNVTKMAYVLATNSLKINRTPKFDEGLSFQDDQAVADQLSVLGYAILRFRMKKESIPPLYAVFKAANPEIRSRFYFIDESPEIVTATGAITMLQMFFSHENEKRYIENMIK